MKDVWITVRFKGEVPKATDIEPFAAVLAEKLLWDARDFTERMTDGGRIHNWELGETREGATYA